MEVIKEVDFPIIEPVCPSFLILRGESFLPLSNAAEPGLQGNP